MSGEVCLNGSCCPIGWVLPGSLGQSQSLLPAPALRVTPPPARASRSPPSKARRVRESGPGREGGGDECFVSRRSPRRAGAGRRASGRGRGHRPGWDGEAVPRAGMLATLTGLLLATPLLADEPYEFARAAGTLGALTFVGLWAAWCWARSGVVARPSRAYLPMALLLALVVLQLIPLGMPTLARLSPRAAELRRETAAALGDRTPTAAPLSLDPGATAEELMLMASGVLFFWAAFNGPDDRRHLRRIGLVLVGVGSAAAGLLYLQRAFGDEALFWVYPGARTGRNRRIPAPQPLRRLPQRVHPSGPGPDLRGYGSAPGAIPPAPDSLPRPTRRTAPSGGAG